MLALNSDIMRDFIRIVENAETLERNVIRLSGCKPRPDSPVAAFLEDFQAITAAHPIARRARLLGNASIELRPSLENCDRTIYVSDIVALIKGGGSEGLRGLCDLADKHGCNLELLALGYSKTPTPKLVIWYIEHGFMPVEYDFMTDLEDGVRMVRKPHASGLRLPDASEELSGWNISLCSDGIDAALRGGSPADRALAEFARGVKHWPRLYRDFPQVYSYFVKKGHAIAA